MSQIELIRELTLTSGISGHESAVSAIMKRELPSADRIEHDRIGNHTFFYSGIKQEPRILLCAHLDEIGFLVSAILPSGFIRFQNIGGWDPNTLLSSPVEIINEDDQAIPGIIGSLPIHFQKDRKEQPDLNKMFIDIGATSDREVMEKFKIKLGNPVVPVPNFHYNSESNIVFSKAFDDRIGIAALIELGKYLEDNTHPNTVLLTGSVQEEVGTRGARTLARTVQADLCLILEGAPADDYPGYSGQTQTAMGKGCHIRLFDPTLLVHKGLKKIILDTADKYQIRYQPAVRKGGGTDGMQLYTAAFGIPTIVLGVPVRYAHSHNCMVSLDDYQELIKLLKAIVSDFDSSTLENL
ncbi:MAG: M42 family metallopeptidase [Candidatus Cloacimonetes bacterium]|nr:M42 family metallopeptidase [Candidatus Cloacimonadota bacterium]